MESMNALGKQRFFSFVLRAAAVYNIMWGIFTVFWPDAYFDWLGLERMNYPMMWQGVGMIVGVYGVGYWIAAVNPVRHWPIVLVGFMGKLLGPIGMAGYVFRGVLPLKIMWLNMTNDLIWLLPFALILGHVWTQARTEGKNPD